LERRGHRFVRYADDSNVYVRSERAGQRVMRSLTAFIAQTDANTPEIVPWNAELSMSRPFILSRPRSNFGKAGVKKHALTQRSCRTIQSREKSPRSDIHPSQHPREFVSLGEPHRESELFDAAFHFKTAHGA
jgi:hypothetical protein